MSKKLEAQLRPCPICGGRGRLKKKHGHYNITIGHSFSASTTERYIMCENCHARTQARGKIINLVDAWNNGYIFPAMKEIAPAITHKGNDIIALV